MPASAGGFGLIENAAAIFEHQSVDGEVRSIRD